MKTWRSIGARLSMSLGRRSGEGQALRVAPGIQHAMPTVGIIVFIINPKDNWKSLREEIRGATDEIFI